MMWSAAGSERAARCHERRGPGSRGADLARRGMQFAIYPLELVRTRLAVCPAGHYRGILDCFSRVLREEGHRAFYRGLTPSLARALAAPPQCSAGRLTCMRSCFLAVYWALDA
jgi:hypothetical protein